MLYHRRQNTHNRRVVRDLLDDKDGLSSTVDIGPKTVEQLSEDGVEGLTISVTSSRCWVHPPFSPIPFSRYGSVISTAAIQVDAVLTVYCPLRVAMNHLRTSSILSRGVAPDEMAANMSGCSHQYAGNSVRETGERMTRRQRPNRA